MSGLLFLGNEDFFVSKGSKGPILCNSIDGFSLILFYSIKCQHCQILIPIFKNLPGTIGGCQFGMMNVSANKQCIKMSKETIAPITYVPYLVLYIGGKPFMRYHGPHDINEIRRFIIEVSQKVNNKQKFAIESSSSTTKEIKQNIPGYAIGHPLVGEDNITYLNFEDAYIDGK